ncbi:MAG: RNA polymerase sigma factor RpoD, partial [Nitrosomonas sp.]
MPKTKAVESKDKDNKIIKKSTAQKIKDAGNEMVEKEESKKLTAKTEKSVKATGKKTNEKATSLEATDPAEIKEAPVKPARSAAEFSQAMLGSDDIEFNTGKKARGRTPKKNKAAGGLDSIDDI